MAYRSVDEIQKLLAKEVFHHTADTKKASGRSLGTLIEIITFYLIRQWGLDSFTTIEHRLQEYANDSIVHNVEFALNPKLKEFDIDIGGLDFPISSKKLLKYADRLNEIRRFSSIANRNIVQLHKGKPILKNSSNLAYDEKSGIVAIANIIEPRNVKVSLLLNRPFAIFECKRVGIEEGAGKGPTTIEKAKQGAYVALHASSFQKVRGADGKLYGVMPKPGEKFEIKPYDEGLKYFIEKAPANELKDFVLTVGVVSNHGNWFTSDNPNKELLVLMQSYDWLLFLTDEALCTFIEDLILDDSEDNYVRRAFIYSYRKPPEGERKVNIFTKVNMDMNASMQIQNYFSKNIKNIDNEWFNILSPIKGNIDSLKKELQLLTRKRWFG